jgi:hypothetical protein
MNRPHLRQAFVFPYQFKAEKQKGGQDRDWKKLSIVLEIFNGSGGCFHFVDLVIDLL